jgi:lysine 2,3-aminomutase
MKQENQDHTIRSMAELGSLIPLTEDEKAFQEGKQALPVAINPYFFHLIDPNDSKDPIRRQVVPTRFEQNENLGEDIDPLEEKDHSITDRLIHRYKNRVAFLVTDICPVYCRHCFRRRFTGTFNGPATKEQIEEVAKYLKQHTEVTEILLTGGDMMTLSDSKIEELISLLRLDRPDLIIRLCTRTPASWPQRITDELITILKKHTSAPFYVMTQFNHPRELTTEAKIAIAKFVDAGIPAMNQTVLLRGVNDSEDILEELCNKLVANRVKPYYLFQGDLVSGTAHFRVPIKRGMEIAQELHRRLSGLAMPSYTVDLPQGGGKVPLGKSYIEKYEENGTWTIKTPEGERRLYQDPPSGV